MVYRAKSPGILIWPDGHEELAISLLLTAEAVTDAYDVTEYAVGGGQAADHIWRRPRELTLSAYVADTASDGSAQDPAVIAARLRAWARTGQVVVVDSDWSDRGRWLVSQVAGTVSPDGLWARQVEITLSEYRTGSVEWTTVRLPARMRRRRRKKKPAAGSGIRPEERRGLLPVDRTSPHQSRSTGSGQAQGGGAWGLIRRWAGGR